MDVSALKVNGLSNQDLLEVFTVVCEGLHRRFGKPTTINCVHAILDKVEPPERVVLKSERIKIISQSICSAFGVRHNQVWGRGGDYRVSWARQAMYYEMKRQTNWSYSEIGRICNRDHATVMAGVKAWTKDYEKRKPKLEGWGVVWSPS